MENTDTCSVNPGKLNISIISHSNEVELQGSTAVIDNSLKLFYFLTQKSLNYKTSLSTMPKKGELSADDSALGTSQSLAI